MEEIAFRQSSAKARPLPGHDRAAIGDRCGTIARSERRRESRTSARIRQAERSSARRARDLPSPSSCRSTVAVAPAPAAMGIAVGPLACRSRNTEKIGRDDISADRPDPPARKLRQPEAGRRRRGDDRGLARRRRCSPLFSGVTLLRVKPNWAGHRSAKPGAPVHTAQRYAKP